MITIESIERKLGFDPLNPPEEEHDSWLIDDAKPRPTAILTDEESRFLFNYICEKLGIK